MLSADLVLEGGGVKGIALAGAITVLMERGYEFNRIAGTSAGSIVGALVAAGFSRDELVSAVRSIDYRKFRDRHPWDHLAVGKLFQLATEQGIYQGRYLTTWLAEQLATRGVHTFADLRCADGQPPFAESDRAYRLVVNVSDITAGCLRQLPWDYRQHYQRDPAAQPVVDAVRGSMSIPFFYQPAVITDGDGLEHWIVDGGMLSNFPISLFDTPPDVPPRWPTFGIKLSVKPSAAGDAVANRVHDTASMSLAMLDTMTGFYDRMHIGDPAVLARTIFVDTFDIKATDFDLTDQQRDALFASGRNAATRFLDGTEDQPGWDWERYKKIHRIPPDAATPPAI